MAFTFAAFTYICALIIDAFLIFFAIFHVSIRIGNFYKEDSDMLTLLYPVCFKITSFLQIIAFDELKTDYKNPIDQCASLNPLVITLLVTLTTSLSRYLPRCCLSTSSTSSSTSSSSWPENGSASPSMLLSSRTTFTGKTK